MRLITDCRYVNSFIDCPTFSQEGVQHIAQQIREHDKLFSIDLTKGFHHVEIHQSHRWYLGCQWRGQYYCWNVLPFGVKSAPYFFHKLLREVLTFLRRNRIRCTIFVDDLFVMTHASTLTDHREFCLQSLEDLGLTVNFDKCDLQGNTVCDHIGYRIYSTSARGPWIEILPKKIQKLRRNISRVLRSPSGMCSARVLARIAGQCVAMTKAVLPAKLLLRNLYRIIARRTSWDEPLTLDVSCRHDLQWWFTAVNSWNGAPLVLSTPDVQLTTDASGSGWGGFLPGAQTHLLFPEGSEFLQAAGTWTKRVSMEQSNFRELLAVLKCLQSFGASIRNLHVQVISDNITTVACLSKLGTPSPLLHALMTTIFVHCHHQNVTLSAKWLAGRHNQRADHLSRTLSTYEWQLHPGVFQMVEDMWGPHTVDRFASQTTRLLPRYNSLYLDPDTEGVDALAQTNWPRENNFVNCPFFLLPDVLRKIQQTGSWATVVTPRWVGQPWYQRLQDMAVCPPIWLPKSRNLILKRAGLPEPWKNRKWQLGIWRVFGGNG